MSSMESPMVPDTVQLMVDVAGLWSSAPALDVMRPAGMAPRLRAHKNSRYQCSRNSSVFSTLASARATRLNVPSMSWSTAPPDFDLRRYFMSQMSSEASCKAISGSADVKASAVTLMPQPLDNVRIDWSCAQLANS